MLFPKNTISNFFISDTTARPNIITTLFEKLMCVFLILLPCGISLIEIAKYFYIYQSSYGLPFSFMSLILICIILCFSCFCLAWRQGKNNTETSFSVYSSIISICIAAFLVRIIASCILNGNPENDFLSVYNAAVDPITYAKTYKSVPYYGIYAVIINIAMKLFNSTEPLVVMFIQAVITSFIPGILFAAVKLFTGKNFPAFIAALLYAFFPSMILFSICVAGENISQFFMACCFLFLVLAWKSEKNLNVKGFIVYTILACFSAALCNIFKPIGQLILVVFFTEELFYRIIPAISGFFKEHNFKTLLKQLSISIFIIILLQGACSITTFVSAKIIELHTGYKTSDVYYGTTTFAEIAYFGLEKEGQGIWNKNVADKRDHILQNSPSVEEAHATMLTTIFEQFKNSPRDFLNLLHNKILISWSDEWAYGYYSSVSDEGNISINDTHSGFFVLTALPRMYIGLLYLACVIEFIFLIFSKRKFWQREQSFIAMFFGIFTLSFLILEAHTRYKSTFMPLLCIMAALGASQACNFIISTIKNQKAKVDKVV